MNTCCNLSSGDMMVWPWSRAWHHIMLCQARGWCSTGSCGTIHASHLGERLWIQPLSFRTCIGSCETMLKEPLLGLCSCEKAGMIAHTIARTSAGLTTEPYILNLNSTQFVFRICRISVAFLRLRTATCSCARLPRRCWEP